MQVTESGSFSKAAKVLFLTQPTVSAHISTLEKELNVRLFVRNTKEVTLSEDGRTLYQYARQMIDMEKKIESIFAPDAKKETKCITIAASTVPAQYLLPGILAEFSKRYPHEQFKIMEMDSSQVVEKIVSHMVEVGFTGTVLEKKHCKYIPLYKDELVVLTPNTEKYRAIQEKGGSLRWVQNENIIMREEGSGTRKEAEKQLRRAGIDTDKLNIVASSENTEMIKKSVKTGIGIAMLSRLAAHDELESGVVLEFPLSGKGGGRDLNLVYNKNYQLSPSAERFIKVVKELYEPGKEED